MADQQPRKDLKPELVWLFIFAPIWYIGSLFLGNIKYLFPIEWRETIAFANSAFWICLGLWGWFSAKQDGPFVDKLMALQIWAKKVAQEGNKKEKERDKK